MVEMTAVHHDAAGGYTLIELPDDTDFGWSARSHGEPPYRYILPDILVEEEGIAEIKEISSMDLPLAGVLSLCPGLDKIYAKECEKYDARVAVPTNHYRRAVSSAPWSSTSGRATDGSGHLMEAAAFPCRADQRICTWRSATRSGT